MAEEDTLEPTTDEDISDLASLMNRAFGNTAWHLKERLYTGTRTSESRLRDEMAQSPQGVLLQWKKGGKRLGCAFLAPVQNKDGIWHLGTLCIEPALQAGGMGRKLLNMAEQYALQQGASAVEIEVVQLRTPLIEWYERRGYQPTGETQPFPYHISGIDPLRDDMHMIVMQKDLQ
jgi:ribosomal protein S18 acetylase RimI-like enzyme